jgi:hypothetical protein
MVASDAKSIAALKKGRKPLLSLSKKVGIARLKPLRKTAIQNRTV